MAKKLCEICGEKPATVPDRERMGRLINRVCSSCHALRLAGDMKRIMELHEQRRSALTAGLGGWCSGVRALVCMYCHRRDMPTDGPALLPKPRITQDGDCAQHIDPPEKPKGGLAEAVKMARGGDAPIPFKRW